MLLEPRAARAVLLLPQDSRVLPGAQHGVVVLAAPAPALAVRVVGHVAHGGGQGQEHEGRGDGDDDAGLAHGEAEGGLADHLESGVTCVDVARGVVFGWTK